MLPSTFIHQLVTAPDYDGELVHVERIPASDPVYGELAHTLVPALSTRLKSAGVEHLFRHQAAAIDSLLDGRNVVINSPSASGKSLCYQIPAVEMLLRDPEATALLLFPTKALCQDQFQSMRRLLDESGLDHQIAMPDAPPPDSVPDMRTRMAPWAEQLGDWFERPRPIDTRYVDFVAPGSHEPLPPLSRVWMRADGVLHPSPGWGVTESSSVSEWAMTTVRRPRRAPVRGRGRAQHRRQGAGLLRGGRARR